MGAGASPMKKLIYGPHEPGAGRYRNRHPMGRWEVRIIRQSVCPPSIADLCHGAARLARLTQATIVACVPWIEGKKRVVLKRGTPILRLKKETGLPTSP